MSHFFRETISPNSRGTARTTKHDEGFFSFFARRMHGDFASPQKRESQVKFFKFTDAA